MSELKPDQGLAEALTVIQSTVRHLKAATGSWNSGPTGERVVGHAMMCLARDVVALEQIGRRLEASEIARSKISFPAPSTESPGEWRLVPVEPTEDVILAMAEAAYADEWKVATSPPPFRDENPDYWIAQARVVYAAMLSTLPVRGRGGEGNSSVAESASEGLRPFASDSQWKSTVPQLGAFCPACQAIPQAGYCNLAGCPMDRPQRKSEGEY